METQIENAFTSELLAEKFIQDTLQKTNFEDADEAKQFIEAIYYCQNQGKRNLKSLAQTLESNIRTVFNSSHKYIYELLQNADDVGATEVGLNIQGETLLFSHSGSHFRPSDVEKICDNAQPRGNKAGEIDKTGYKGVGFKANFCISNRITVLSKHVCFRFDQESFKQPLDYPWPIMPIWTNKDTLLSSLDPHKVHFYLERIDPIKVCREIEEIFLSPEVLLLLRHINCVTLHHLGLRVMRVKNEERITLQKIQNETSIYEQQYSIYECPIDIPVEQKEYLKRLPPSECPEKLKIAETVTITFAVQLNSHGLPTVAKRARLYAYLPTDILSGLPFWVNTEFLLKQDRGQLLDNSWNQYLMREIGKLQFTVLRQIAENNHATKNRVLKLLPPHELSNHQLAYFRDAYQDGFDEGFSTVAFIPSISNTLLRRNECIIDEHQFFSSECGGFTKSLETQAVFGNLWSDVDSALIVEPLLGSPEVLKTKLRLPGKFFSAQDLVTKLAQYMKVILQNTSSMIKLWSYLMSADSELLKTLKEQPWLMLKSGGFQVPAKCFLPIDSNLDPDLSELEIIDESILPSDIRTPITNWLIQHLSVGQFTWHDVIKIHYPKLISEHKVDKQRAIRMLWQIYTAYQSKSISEETVKQLGSIFPIEIGMSITPMNQCMIPMALIENGTAPQDFLERIPNDYFLGNYPYDVTVLRGLLITMGVRTELAFIYHHEVCIENINRSIRLNKYIAHCQTQYSQITSLFVTPSHKVKYFFDCDFIEKIGSPGYKEIFWRLLVENFAFMLQTTYIAPRQGISLPIISPILFYLKNETYLTAKDRAGFYSPHQLYVASFFSNFDEFPLLIADIPEDIPLEVLNTLGFKTLLTFDDAMILLDSPVYRRQPKMLQLIYRGILAAYEQTSISHNARLMKFLQNKTLLSTQGHLKKCDNLFWMDLHNDPGTESYCFIDPCGLSFEEMRNLAKIFRLKSFSRESLDTLSTVSLETPQDAARISQELKLKILDFLPFAVVYTALQEGLHTAVLDEIATGYYQKLLTLTLTCCDDLCFALEQLTVSGSEVEKEKVVVKDHEHEILFTKQAYDNESSQLNDALSARLFVFPELKKSFSEYMDKPLRIRHQELEIKKRSSAEMLTQVKQFFDTRRQLLVSPPSLFHAKLPYRSTEQSFSQQQPVYSNGGHLHTLWNASRPSPVIGSNAAKTSTRSTKEIEKTAQNIQTGYEGEEKFYDYLLEQTRKLFSDATISETSIGYDALNSHGQVFLKVRWFNKEAEQRKAMDFEVEYLGQRYIFEIKTTLGTERHAFISSSEMKQLQEHKGNYALVFVFGNGDIHIRWNPAQKISDSILHLIPTQYQMELTQSDDAIWGAEEYHVDKGCVMS